MMKTVSVLGWLVALHAGLYGLNTSAPIRPTAPSGGTNRASTSFKYNIGDFAQGGVVIWVTNDGQHGLVAAIEDQGIHTWGSNGDTAADVNNSLPFATPAAPYGQYYGGYLNQQAIQTSQTLSNFPAFQAAANYSITVNGIEYSDWFLPSLREVLLIYVSKTAVNEPLPHMEDSPLQMGSTGPQTKIPAISPKPTPTIYPQRGSLQVQIGKLQEAHLVVSAA